MERGTAARGAPGCKDCRAAPRSERGREGGGGEALRDSGQGWPSARQGKLLVARTLTRTTCRCDAARAGKFRTHVAPHGSHHGGTRGARRHGRQDRQGRGGAQGGAQVHGGDRSGVEGGAAVSPRHVFGCIITERSRRDQIVHRKTVQVPSCLSNLPASFRPPVVRASSCSRLGQRPTFTAWGLGSIQLVVDRTAMMHAASRPAALRCARPHGS